MTNPAAEPHRAGTILGTAAEVVCLLLLGAALALGQALIGGTRAVFALPVYAVVGLAGVLSLLALAKKRPPPDSLCLWATLLFFGYIATRALTSPVIYLARADLWSVLAGLVVYFLVAGVLVSARQRLWLLAGLLFLGLAHVGVGALQFRDGNNFMPIHFLQRFDYGRRASGFYICPNHLAGLLEVIALMGLSVVCWSRWPAWSKLLLGYAVAVAFAGLLLTGSRGGYLSALAGLAVFGLLSLRLLREAGGALFWRLALSGAALVVVAGTLVFISLRSSEVLRQRAGTTFDAENVRLDLWRAGVEQWKLQPVWGTGSGTYLFYGRQFRSERVQRDPVYAHNDYVQLLAEYGLAGAVTCLVFLGFHLRRGLKNFQRLGPDRLAIAPALLSNAMALNIGALAATATYLVHSVFDFNLHIAANVLLLAFVFGVLANDGVFRSRERRGRWHPAWAGLPALLGLLLLFLAWRHFPVEREGELARTSLRDQQPVRAAYYARRALAQETRNPLFFDYLGTAHQRQAEALADETMARSFYEAALPPFRRALELAPRDATYAIDVGFVLDRLGRHEEATPFYELARSLDPRSDSVRRYYEAHLAQRKNGALRPEKGGPARALPPSARERK